MITRTRNKKIASAAAVLISTAVCAALIMRATLGSARVLDGKRFDGRTLDEWMFALNETDTQKKQLARDAIRRAGDDAAAHFSKILTDRRANLERRIQAAEALAFTGRNAHKSVPVLLPVL